VAPDKDCAMKARLVIEGETYFAGTRVEQPQLTAAVLAAYARRFYGEELDATYDSRSSKGL